MDISLLTPIIAALIAAIFASVRYFYTEFNKYKSINKALLSEISRLLKVVNDHTIFWRGCIQNQDIDIPLVNFSTEIYDVLIKDIGRIDRMYAGEGVRLYGYVKFLNRFQSTREQHIAIGKLHIFSDFYLKALEAFNRKFDGKFKDAFDKYKIKLVL